jgi:hypothetical protein
MRQYRINIGRKLAVLGFLQFHKANVCTYT